MTPPLPRNPPRAPGSTAASALGWSMTHPGRMAIVDRPRSLPEGPRCERNGAVGDQSEITFRLLDGTQAAGDAEDLQALHAEVYGDQPDDGFARRFRVLRPQL